MSKLELMKLTFEKLAADKRFFAYYLKLLMRLDGLDTDEICRRLNCNEETFYRLALCKAPEPQTSDFAIRVRNVAEYSGLKADELAFLVLSTYSVDERPYLHLNLPIFSKLFTKLETSLKNGFEKAVASRRSRLVWRFGQFSLSMTLCLLFILNFTGQSKSQNLRNFYQNEYAPYHDSVKSICLKDKTEIDLPLKKI